jgi:hypothetical protein
MPLPVKGKLVRMRPLPFKDYDYIGNRYVNIQDETNNRAYHIIFTVGGGYNNNFISIKRLN